MKEVWLFLLLLGWVGSLHAQTVSSEELYVTGVVWDKDSMVPLPDAVCRYGNVVSGVDRQGRFSLQVNAGDTLRFTHVGYAAMEIIISDSLRQKDYLMGVFLPRDTILLAEFVIFPRYVLETIRINSDQLCIEYNMKRALHEALSPVKVMDRNMNQKMQIEKFARSIEMKGHVDVGFGIGTPAIYAWRKLRLSRSAKRFQEMIRTEEIDLLKKIFYLEKERKENN